MWNMHREGSHTSGKLVSPKCARLAPLPLRIMLTRLGHCFLNFQTQRR